MESQSPVLSQDRFREAARAGERGDVMTIEGAVHKSIVLGAITMAAAFFVWTQVTRLVENPYAPGAAAVISQAAAPYLFTGLIGGLVLCLVITLKAGLAPWLAWAYAALEGLFIGGLSSYVESRHPGIAMQAAGLTIGTLLGMLLLYKAGFIRVTEKFRSILVMVTGAIAMVYLVSLVMNAFGSRMPLLHDASPLGIGISLAITAVAALNLLLDFELIEEGARQQAPRYMEWYAAFALLVTVVWLYIEIIRLLSKLQRK